MCIRDPMFLRFEIEEKDQDSGHKMGLFSAMGELVHDGVLYEYEIDLEKEIYSWFKENLKVPRVQASDSAYYAKPGAISWFKNSAIDHIDKMRQYAQILDAHGVSVLQVKTDRPGNIVYEDKYQIAAIPFNDTFK